MLTVLSATSSYTYNSDCWRLRSVGRSASTSIPTSSSKSAAEEAIIENSGAAASKTNLLNDLYLQRKQSGTAVLGILLHDAFKPLHAIGEKTQQIEDSIKILLRQVQRIAKKAAEKAFDLPEGPPILYYSLRMDYCKRMRP
jgi:hypothetical protein